jgi:hypothetical protein
MFKSIIKASAIATIAVVSAISFAEARSAGGGNGGGGAPAGSGGNGSADVTPEIAGMHAAVPSVTFLARQPGQQNTKYQRAQPPGPNDCANTNNPKLKFACQPD